LISSECDDGQCGDNWETWGNPTSFLEDLDEDSATLSSADVDDSSSTKQTEEVKVPYVPYTVDGYARKDLDELTPFQFSRFDCRSSKAGKTVSFRKMDKL